MAAGQWLGLPKNNLPDKLLGWLARFGLAVRHAARGDGLPRQGDKMIGSLPSGNPDSPSKGRISVFEHGDIVGEQRYLRPFH